MSVKNFLDDLLTQGKALAAKGEDLAASKLGYSDSPEDRRKLRTTAAAGGLLGLLLGTRSGRGLVTTGVVLGGLGWLGKKAYDAYQGSEAQAPRADELTGEAAEKRAIAIASAIIAAARSDGHIDAAERASIDKALAGLPADVQEVIAAEMVRPVDPGAIALLADSPQAAREIFAASLLVTGADNDHERAFLADLSAELNLTEADQAAIRTQLGLS